MVAMALMMVMMIVPLAMLAMTVIVTMRGLHVQMPGVIVTDHGRGRHRRHRGRQLQVGFARYRQRTEKAATLDPNQPRAERRDQPITCDLDGALGTAHGPGGNVEQPCTDPDDHHRDQRLRQRGGEGQRDAAPRCFLVGDEIGRDHRLAMSRPGRVEDAVSERDAEQRPDRAAIVPGRTNRR